MFSWRVRFVRIIELIRMHSVDVITFQEIHEDQLQFLISRLPPEYQYHHHFATNSNSDESKSSNQNVEGLAIISKNPITDIVPYSFSKSKGHEGGDMNPRMMVKLTISLTEESSIDLYLTHLTYDKSLQCQHVKEMRQQILTQSVPNDQIKSVLITGDLNVYHDFVFPMELLQFGKTGGNKQCLHHWAFEIGSDFIDVFESMIDNEADRLTFSNMPWPGMVSRPDRLLMTNLKDNGFLKIKSVEIIGDGVYYGERYYYRILWYRLKMVWNGKECPFDCGPNGFCRCGNCVGNPNGIADEMDDCAADECSSCARDMQTALIWVSVVVVMHLVGYLCCVRGLYIRPRVKYLEWSVPTSRLFPLSCTIFVVVILWYWMTDTFDAVRHVMAEELFPSDHRGLVAVFTF